MNDRKKRILVIEDDSDFLKGLETRLQMAGYEIITASDGFIGLERARSDHPDLIILDVLLSKMNGFKVARFLKFDEPYKNIPIIMLTARTEESERKLGMETGADAYFTKPYDPEQFLKAIAKFLEEKGNN